MPKARRMLADTAYEMELSRLAHLKEFPHIPILQRELVRAMRTVTETDGEFLHRLITSLIDNNVDCPRPADIIAAADRARAVRYKPPGDPGCEDCHGSGFRQVTRRVHVHGVEPYTADAAEICKCRGKA